MNSILGTHLIVFDADGSKLRAETDKVEKATKRSAQNIDRDVQRGITNAMRVAGEATAKLGSGAKMTAGDLSRLAAAAVHLERVEAKDEVTTRRLAKAKELLARTTSEATGRIRQQKIVLSDMQQATTAAGFHATSLSGAVQDLARNMGAGGLATGVAKGTVAVWLAREAWQALKGTVHALNTSDTNAWWSEQSDNLKKFHAETKTKVYDMAFAWLAYHKARLTGDLQGMVDAAKGAAAPPLRDPKSRHANEHAINDFNASNRKVTLEQIGREKAVFGLQLQAAELRKNATEALNLGIILAKLEHAEARLNGTSKEHADTVRDLTIKNLRLAAANDIATEAARRQEQILQQIAPLLKDKMAAAGRAASDSVGARLSQLALPVFDMGSEIAPQLRARRTAQIAADLARQMVEITRTREEELRQIEREAHAERAREYRQLAADQRITATQSHALISQSRALLDERMRQIDADYGQSWDHVMGRIARGYASTMLTTEAVAMRGFGSLEEFLTTLSSGAVKNFGDVQDAARSMLRSITADIMRMMSQKAVMWLIGMASGGGAQQGAKAMNYFSAFGSLVFANGGVAKGGFLPMQAFATGGVVTRPTIGLVGEGRHNEAIVPLPDGKSIPVKGIGGGRQPINVHVSWTPQFIRSIISGAAEQGAAIAAQQVIPIVAEDIGANGTLRAMFRGEV